MRTTQKYLFHHLFKSGGTSLISVFEQVLGAENVFHARESDLFSPLRLFDRFQMVCGHFGHTRGSCFDPNRAYITFLREPVDRVVSAYYFWRSQPDWVSDEGVLRAKALTFENFLDDDTPAVQQLIGNFQTHAFAYADPAVNGLSQDELLGKANEVIGSYQFVGIHEHFADSIDLLCYEMGWPAATVIPHLNKGTARPSRDDITATLRSKIRKLNALDEELHLRCKAELQARKRQLFRSFMLLSRPILPLPPTEPSLLPESSHPQATDAPSVGTNLEIGDRQIEIIDVRIVGDKSRTNIVAAGDMARIAILIGAHIDTNELTVGISLRNSLDQVVFGTNTFHLQYPLEVLAGQTYCMTYQLRLDLGPGSYCLGVSLHTGDRHHLCCYHVRHCCATLDVVQGLGAFFEGHTKLYPSLEISRVAPLLDWQANMTLANPPLELFAGENAEVLLNVHNCSSETWYSWGLTPVTCSYHIWNTDGRLIEFDGLRTPLPADLKPGEQLDLSIQVAAPFNPGEYIVGFSLVQEGIAWFEDNGFTVPQIRVLVRPNPTSC